MNQKPTILSTIALAYISGTAAGQCTTIFNETVSRFDVEMTLTSPCEFSEGFGMASAFSYSTIQPVAPICGNNIDTCLDGDVNVFVGYGSTSALSNTCGYASAHASLYPTSLHASGSAVTSHIRDCADCGYLYLAGGSAGASISTTVDCEWSVDIEISAEAECDGAGVLPAQPSGFWINYVGPGGIPITTFFAAGCTPGSTPICGEDGEVIIPISGFPGPINFGIIPAGSYGDWDYNMDGRVNQIDLADLFGIIPTTLSGSSDPLRIFDLDNDNDVDYTDISLLGNFFSSLDQGVAGDDDGDLVTDCDDLAGVLAHQFDPALTVCDPDYRIEFDVDLDGDNDLDDRRAILLMIQPADLAADGTMNYFDVAAFLDAYNNMEPEGDFNGDSSFNYFDVDAFLDSYSNDACP